MLPAFLERAGLKSGVALASGALLLLATSSHLKGAEGPHGTSSKPGTASSRATAAGGGVPFGASKLPSALFGKPFTETKLEVSPDSIRSDLTQAQAGGVRVFIILVGPQHHYQNANGTFNLAMWKARVDRFRGIDLSGFVKDGTIIAHQLVSEAKAKSQFGEAVIPNDVLDEMAGYSKQVWPTMATMLRTDPTDLEEHAAGYKAGGPSWKWTHLDAASARYLARKGSVAKFAADQQASADRQRLALVVGLNVFSGGNGSSEIRSPADGKWAMSADELRQYGSAMLSGTKPCAFEMWRYESANSEFANFRYFRRPEMMAVMVELAALAARSPARSCVGGQQQN